MFFDQIKDIDSSLKSLREHLKTIGGAVDRQLEEIDDVAAHVIALEALMLQVLKTTAIDVDAAKEWVRINTEKSSGKEGGSTKARQIIENLTAR